MAVQCSVRVRQWFKMIESVVPKAGRRQRSKARHLTRPEPRSGCPCVAVEAAESHAADLRSALFFMTCATRRGGLFI